MIVDERADGDPRRMPSPRQWALWSIPAPARSFMLLVEAVAAALTITLLVVQSVSHTDVIRVAVLAALAIGYAEATVRFERLKRYLGSDKVFSNEVSVWTFAGALILPAGWAAVLAVLIYAHVLVQRRRDKSGHPYRVVFTAAAAVLSVLAASAVLAAAGGGDVLRGGLIAPLAVVAALLGCTLVNFGLVLTGMRLTLRPPSMRAMLPDTDAIGYELATLGLGIVTAEFMLHTPALTLSCSGWPSVCIAARWLPGCIAPRAPTPRRACSPLRRGPTTPPVCYLEVSGTNNRSPSCSVTSTTSRPSTTATVTTSVTTS